MSDAAPTDWACRATAVTGETVKLKAQGVTYDRAYEMLYAEARRRGLTIRRPFVVLVSSLPADVVAGLETVS